MTVGYRNIEMMTFRKIYCLVQIMVSHEFYGIVTTSVTVQVYSHNFVIVGCVTTQEYHHICQCWFDSGSMKTGWSRALMSVVSNGSSDSRGLVPLHWLPTF